MWEWRGEQQPPFYASSTAKHSIERVFVQFAVHLRSFHLPLLQLTPPAPLASTHNLPSKLCTTTSNSQFIGAEGAAVASRLISIFKFISHLQNLGLRSLLVFSCRRSTDTLRPWPCGWNQQRRVHRHHQITKTRFTRPPQPADPLTPHLHAPSPTATTCTTSGRHSNELSIFRGCWVVHSRGEGKRRCCPVVTNSRIHPPLQRRHQTLHRSSNNASWKGSASMFCPIFPLHWQGE